MSLSSVLLSSEKSRGSENPAGILRGNPSLTVEFVQLVVFPLTDVPSICHPFLE